jgi:hypothetical protein
VHRVAALARRWLLRTGQGPVGNAPSYLNGLCLRWNRRVPVIRWRGVRHATAALSSYACWGAPSPTTRRNDLIPGREVPPTATGCSGGGTVRSLSSWSRHVLVTLLLWIAVRRT